jgi:hypothetical protein
VGPLRNSGPNTAIVVLTPYYCAEPIAPMRALNLKSIPIPNGGRYTQYIHDSCGDVACIWASHRYVPGIYYVFI